MVPEKIQLEIVTPNRLFFSGEVEEVTVPGIKGYMGILPGHAPLLSELKAGVISYNAQGRTVRLFCGWGFVEVLPERVSLMSEEVALPEEVDVEEARAIKERAQRLLQSKDPQSDFRKAVVDIHRANALLEAARHAGGKSQVPNPKSQIPTPKSK